MSVGLLELRPKENTLGTSGGTVEGRLTEPLPMTGEVTRENKRGAAKPLVASNPD